MTRQARPGQDGQGQERRDKAGAAGRGEIWIDTAWQGAARQAGPDAARPGQTRLGQTRQGEAGNGFLTSN